VLCLHIDHKSCGSDGFTKNKTLETGIEKLNGEIHNSKTEITESSKLNTKLTN